MPPLRERPEDIPLLARHFIEKFTRELGKPMRSLSNEASRRLVQYPWPGNVRELENIIERAIILSKNTDYIDIQDLPLNLQGGAGDAEASLKLEDAVKQFAKQHIHSVLGSVFGDKKEAAKILGMSLSSLYRKLEELEIPK
jgi:transcriptional regulator with PAS, ATPase and Fis domain